MKRAAALAALLLLFSACVNHEARDRRARALLWLSVAVWDTIDHEECLSFESPNPVYIGSGYYGKYAADFNAYNSGIILGDSTMDLAVNAYGGYITKSGVGAYPVSGNKTCDMNTQLRNVHAVNPAFVWISTAGGNDLLAGVPDSRIVDSMTALLVRLRARWPAARLCVILVHPTQVTYANEHKGAVNAGVSSVVSGFGNAVSYNPQPLFGVTEGQAAPSSMLIDSIHPTAAMTAQIKAAGSAACSVSF